MLALVFTILAGMLLMLLMILPDSWLRDEKRNRFSLVLTHCFFWILIILLAPQSVVDIFIKFLTTMTAGTLALDPSGWPNFPFAHFAEGLLAFDVHAQQMNLLVAILSYGLYHIWGSQPRARVWSKNSDALVQTNEDAHRGDFSILFFFLLSGAFVINASQHFMLWFIGLEIVSMILYIFAASHKRSPEAVEAGYKYFIAGSVATGFILMGIALIYRSTVNFDFLFAFQSSRFSPADYSYFQMGLLFLLLGVLQKIAAVPFHFWSIDLYQGTPVRITAIMVVLGKIVYFGALYRLLPGLQEYFLQGWENLFLMIAALSMIVGSFQTWRQNDFKRIMAYSSITHSGYLLLLLWMPEVRLIDTVVFLLSAYGFANLGIFAGLSFYWHYRVDLHGIDLPIQALHRVGKERKNQFWIFGILIFLLSLAGIPPLTGFFAKVTLFSSLIANGAQQSVLLIIMILSSALAFVGYLKLILALYGKSMHQNLALNSSEWAPPNTKRKEGLGGDLLLGKSSVQWVFLLCVLGTLFLWILLPPQI